MGAALLVFMPGRMTFEQYFQMGDRSQAEKAARFLVGLAPSMLQMGYLVDPTRVDLANRRVPSTPMAVRPLRRHRGHRGAEGPAEARPRDLCAARAFTSMRTRTASAGPGDRAATHICCSAR
jgi:hypothetical protein